MTNLNRPITRPQKCSRWIAGRIRYTKDKVLIVMPYGCQGTAVVPRYAFDRTGNLRRSNRVKGLFLFHITLDFKALGDFKELTSQEVQDHLKPPVAAKQTRASRDNKAA